MEATYSLSSRTVGEIAAELPGSIPIFEAWKIDYCCGGLTPLTEACAAVGRSMEEFEAALASAPRLAKAIRDFSTETLSAIRDYIINVYHVGTRAELETLQTLAEKVVGVHGSRHAELAEVRRLVAALSADMLPHMMKEEHILIPYVTELEEAESGGPLPTPFFGTVKNPVRMMMMEHDRVGELLAELRQVSGGYTPPADACFSYGELYRRLAEFEQMTHQHIHIENNIYFPRSVALEERIAGG
jgi:regulator of cell morphogenesis and NO signaling